MTMKTNAAAPVPANRLATLILACFFLSGMTALVYEIIWMRMIARVVGGAPFAISTILVVFMGGMGLGSFIAGRKADQIPEMRLVRIYGLLELTIGIYAFCVPVILMVLKPLYGVLYNALFTHTLMYNLTIFAGALVLLCLPAVCMGATLPILCKFYVSRLSHVGSHTGLLYGLNTVGAALGSLICGFWLIDLLGVWGTMLAAVAFNCTIGIVCIRLSAAREAQTAKKHGKKAAGKPTVHLEEPAGIADHPHIRYGALAIFFVSGFCAMAYEVLWTKLLGLVVGPTTYSFTIVLVTFIVGLALGNLIFGRLADRTANPAGLLVATQIAAALVVLAVSQLLGNSQLFYAKLIYVFKAHFALLSLFKALTLFIFMILPTFFLGATFPLVARIYTRSTADVGRSIGNAYAVNTIGAVLGSFCAGFVLVPLMGKENGLRLVMALQLATAFIVGAVVVSRQKMPRPLWAGPAIVALAGLVLCTVYPSWNRLILATGKYHRFDEHAVVDEMILDTGWLEALFKGSDILTTAERGTLVFYGDGIGGFTTVLKYPGPFGIGELSMANSGKMDASSRGDMKTQTLLAHFPMLFAKSPENVMVLGLASGVTAGETLHYPIQRLDVVDINDRVFEAAALFKPWNNDVLNNPKTRLILQDGMAHLSLTRERYDVIISEPSNPWMAGMASLFTRNFFTSAKDKLTDDGIYVQWFHCYQMDWSTFALIGRTFAEVFPDSMLVSCEPGGLSRDFLFVGFKSSGGLDWEAARKNLQYIQHSANINLADPALFYRLLVSQDLKLLFGEGPVNTEDRPRLEYAAPKLMYQGEAAQETLLKNVVGRSWLAEKTLKEKERITQSVDAQIDFAAFALSIFSPFPDMVDLSRADEAQRQRYTGLLASYVRTNPFDFSMIHDADLASHLLDTQIAALENKLPAMQGNKNETYTYLAALYSDKQMPEKVIEMYRKALEEDPEDANTHNNLGFMLSEMGRFDEAVDHFKAALRIRPKLIMAMGNLAYTYTVQGKLDEALKMYEATLRIRPKLMESHYKMGYLLYTQGRHWDAIEHLEKAVAIEPNLAQGLNTLAWILATTQDKDLRDPQKALAYALKANRLSQEQDPNLLFTLSVAYAASGKAELSIQKAEKALPLAQQMGRQDLVQLIQKHLQMLQVGGQG